MRFSDDRWAVKLVSIVTVLSMISMAAMPLLATGDELFEIASGEGDSGAGTTSEFGFNVSKAGDVNGDGIDDFIVGAPNADYNSVSDCGAAFIFFGYDGIQDADLNASNANVSIYGIAASGHFGWDVADAGNVSGDIYADVIIGEPDNGNGKAYIYYGSGSMTAIMTTLDADVTITGGFSGDKFGTSVSGAGELNGDSYDDVIVGAPYNDTSDGSISNAGAAYVYYGGSPMDTTSDASVYGKYTDGYFGYSVSGAGDVDGANNDDLIIGEPGEDYAYIYYGDGSIGSTVTNAYTYVTTNTDTIGTTTNFANAQDSDAAFATITEADTGGTSNVIVNGDFANGTTTDADNWDESTTGTGVTCTRDTANGNPAPSIYFSGPEGCDGDAYANQSFTYNGATPPSTATLDFDWDRQWNSGTTGHLYIVLVKPDASESTLWSNTQTTDVTWTSVTGVDIASEFDQTGTYILSIHGDLEVITGSGARLVRVRVDNVAINIASSTNYRYEVEFTTSSVSAATTHYLEISYKVNSENCRLEIWDGTSFNLETTLTSATATTYSCTLTTNEYNSGNVRVKYVDVTQSSDITQNSVDILYHRVRGASIIDGVDKLLIGDPGTDFGSSVSGIGDVNGGNDDVIVGAPGTTNGNASMFSGGDFDGTGSRTDTTQSDFTASGSSLASSNPSNGMLAAPDGILCLERNYIYQDDFDTGETVGNDPTGWTITSEGTGCDLSVNDTYCSSSPNGLMFNDTDSVDQNIQIDSSFTDTNGFVNMEFKVYVDEQTTDDFFSLAGFDGNDFAFQLGLLAGDIEVRDFTGGDSWEVLMAYVPGCWYTITLAIDCANDQFDIYINGTLEYTDALMANVASVDSVSGITFLSGSVGLSDMWIDDVYVYTYNTPGTYTSSATVTAGYITSITPTWTADTNSQTMTISVSRDDGTTWIAVTHGNEYSFISEEARGKNLKYKVDMSNTNVAYSPVLYDITLAYKYCKAGVTLIGSSPSDKFGFSVTGAGDIDGDGINDILIGAPGNDTSDGSKANGGGVFAFCGGAYLSGTVSASDANYTFFGETAGDMLGWSVGPIGDVNSHGEDDIVVGAPYYNSNAGKAYALSIAIPLKVTSFSVAENSGVPLDVDLSWPKVNGAVKYNVYRSETPWGFDFATPDATVDAPALSWVDTSAARNTTNPHNATTYYYAIRAENALAEEGPYKVYAIHRMDLVVGWNFVSWLSNETMDIETEAFANLEADDGTNPTTFVYDNVDRWNPTSHLWESYTTDGDLGPFSDMAPGYAYAIQCNKSVVWTYVEDCGVPAFSIADDSALTAPGSFTLARNGANPDHVDLSWNTVATADHYNIYRSFTKWGFDFNNPIHSTADGLATSWTDTTSTQENGAYNASVYYYIIRTVDASGDIDKNLNTAAMHRMDFRKGINYMSWVPHESVDIDTVGLASLTWGIGLPSDYMTVYRWNELTQAFMTTDFFATEDFTDFERGYGYGISTFQACTWTYVEYS